MITESSRLARAMYESGLVGVDWPLPSQELEDLDTAGAYRIQHDYVAELLRTDVIAGFKAGATALPAQQAFGLNAPFAGVLLAGGRRSLGASVKTTDFRRLVLETELCFRTGVTIGERVDGVGALRDCIDGCFPAIELADVGGYGRARFTGLDLIAGNGAAAGYLLGDEPDWRTMDLDALTVTFSREGQTLHEAISGDLMEGQWRALLWLVNTVVGLGYEVQAGHLLLSGSLGSPHPAEPGRYLGDFGGFGQIAFEVI